MTSPEPVVYRQHIPSTDPRLGRHIHHDERSKAYAYPTAGLTLTSAKHARRIPVLDQGSVGSCTGNAGVGCLGTDPYYATLAVTAMWRLACGAGRIPDGQGLYATESAARDVLRLHDGACPGVHAVELVPAGRPLYSFDEPGAQHLYSDAEVIDGDGPFPPNDNGSTGLSIAKALKNAGEIAGYQHTFTLQDALLALGQTPVITGVNWYEDMFNPDPRGRLRIGGGVAGGHEFVVDEIDAEADVVWMTNSWGTGWGVGGRAYLTFDDWGRLLSEQGDVTIFTPLTAPAPTPSPTPPTPAPPVVVDDADRAFAPEAHRWLKHPHTQIAGNERMAAAVRRYLAAKGL